MERQCIFGDAISVVKEMGILGDDGDTIARELEDAHAGREMIALEVIVYDSESAVVRNCKFHPSHLMRKV